MLASYTFQMPKIEYALSFENYLEMTKSRSEKKDLRLPTVFAASGFCLIVAGYMTLKMDIAGSFFPGGLFLASGLLFTFLAMLLGLRARSKSSRPDTVGLRREYELFHADRRVIEFDESGWRVSWFEGEDVRPWSCLRLVQEMDTMLVLGTSTTYYWLPKKALQREGQFDRLKTLAESFLEKRERLFEVPLRCSAHVYVAAWLFHNWRRELLRRLLSYAAATLIAYWVVSPGTLEARSAGLWPIALVPLLMVLGEVLFLLINYCKVDWSNVSQSAEIMSDCIGYRTKTVCWIAEYRRLKEMREIPGALLLYFDVNFFHLIPKRGFSPAQIAQFRQVVANR